METVKKDYRHADLPEPTRRVLDYAVKLTKAPGAMAESDVRLLREAGLDDRAILDACEVTAYFNYINRIADGLHVDLEPGMSPR